MYPKMSISVPVAGGIICIFVFATIVLLAQNRGRFAPTQMQPLVPTKVSVFPDTKTISDFEIAACVGLQRMEVNFKKIMPFWEEIAPWAAAWAHRHQKSCRSVS